MFVDATRIERSAPFTDLPILPGQHTIRLTNIEEGIDEVKVIQVAPGELVRVVFDPAEASPVAPVIDVIDAPTREAGGKRPPRKSKKR